MYSEDSSFAQDAFNSEFQKLKKELNNKSLPSKGGDFCILMLNVKFSTLTIYLHQSACFFIKNFIYLHS